MRPALIALSIISLIAVAACNREDSAASNQTAPQDSNVADAATGNTVAQPAGAIAPQQAYAIRHERYEEMGDSLKAINRELKGSAPDVPRIQREAATLATLADQIPNWFPVGSGPDVHAKSRAKAEVWSDPDGFRRAHAAYLEQAGGFNWVAQSGDVAAMRAAVQQLGRSCGNCHDDYRGPER